MDDISVMGMTREQRAELRSRMSQTIIGVMVGAFFVGVGVGMSIGWNAHSSYECRYGDGGDADCTMADARNVDGDMALDGRKK